MPTLRTRLALAAALAVALALPRSAAACSVCACGDPLLAASEAPGMAGALRLALDGEWLQVESAETPGDTNRLRQQTLRLSAVYSPLDALNLVVGVPLTSKVMKSLATGDQLSDETGLGDVDVGARWFAFTSADVGARRAQSLGLSLCTSLPAWPRSRPPNEYRPRTRQTHRHRHHPHRRHRRLVAEPHLTLQ